MLPAEAWAELFKFTGAVATLAGVFDWLRKGSTAEDNVFAEAAEIVLDAVANADNVRTIDCVTGRNLREQLTVEECLDMARERDLRRMPGRN
jgi:hypothetical protein